MKKRKLFNAKHMSLFVGSVASAVAFAAGPAYAATGSSSSLQASTQNGTSAAVSETSGGTHSGTNATEGTTSTLTSGVANTSANAASSASASTSTSAATAPVQNLATNASLEVHVTGIRDEKFESQEFDYQGNLVSGTAWRGFSHQGGRDIDVTLPQPSTVTSLSIDLRQNLQLGISYPATVQFQVRQNGEWHLLGAVENNFSRMDLGDTTQRFTLHIAPTVGQHFRIYFPVGVWVFARDVEVNGKPVVESSAKTGQQYPTVAPQVAKFTHALTPLNTRSLGIANMLLVNASPDTREYTEHDFKPLVAYENSSGQMVGRFFDTILFLADSSTPDTKAGWEQYCQTLFSPTGELANLNAAVAADNKALGTPGVKEKVVLTIPMPQYGDGTFGTVSGQNLSFVPSPQHPFAVQSREAAIQWLFNKLWSGYESGNYSNLQLSGFYWEREDAPPKAVGEQRLIAYTKSLATTKQMPLFWIPFYSADGWERWNKLGFTAAWLQPNYEELGSAAFSSRLTSAEQVATNCGMGLELEWTTLDANGETLYVHQLEQFAQSGYAVGVSHAFYDGTDFLVHAAYSQNPFTRALYDYTYDFVSGNYAKIGGVID
jgi:hypothetical protein